MAGIAGCGGNGGRNSPTDEPNGGDDTPTDTLPSDGAPMDEEFTSYITVPPADTQFNPSRPQNFPSWVNAITSDIFAKYDYVSQDQNWHPMVAEDWQLPETTEEDAVVTVNVSENHTWHDGEPVTAGDIETQFVIDRATGGSAWEFLKDVSVVDDKTIEFTLANAVNKPILRLELFDRRINQPQSRFSEFAEGFKDATSDSETESVQGDLIEYAPEEPLGNGPFQHDSITDQKYILRKYEDYANPYITADDINFPRYGLFQSPAGSDIPELIINGELDGTPQADPQPEQLEQFPEGHTTTHPAFVGEGLILNIGNEDAGYEASEYLDNVNVRKAIGHIFARDRVRVAMPGPGELYGAVPHHTGIMPNAAVALIDELDSFETYAFEDPNTDRATELLEGEGFSFENNLWYTPDGDQWTLSVKSHTAATWLTVAQVASALLQQFGIDVEQSQEESTTYYGDTIPNGDFDLAACNWGGGGANLPYANYQAMFFGRRDGEGFPVPREVEVPMPVGDQEGSLETIEFRPLIQELGTVSDAERRKEIVSELAWGYNQSAFHFPVRVWSAIAYVSTVNWNFPDPESDVDMQLNHPVYWPVRKGKHQAKLE